MCEGDQPFLPNARFREACTITSAHSTKSSHGDSNQAHGQIYSSRLPLITSRKATISVVTAVGISNQL